MSHSCYAFNAGCDRNVMEAKNRTPRECWCFGHGTRILTRLARDDYRPSEGLPYLALIKVFPNVVVSVVYQRATAFKKCCCLYEVYASPVVAAGVAGGVSVAVAAGVWVGVFIGYVVTAYLMVAFVGASVAARSAAPCP